MSYRVEISRRPGCALFEVRGPAASADTVFEGMGVAAPARPNTVRTSGAWAVYWTGPGRWLLRGDRGLPAGASGEAPPDLSIVDVSDAWIRFSIAGPDALDVMSQATPLDLDSGAFPGGNAGYTEFFGTTSLTERESAGTSFVVFVERSYADYVEACLRRAAG